MWQTGSTWNTEVAPPSRIHDKAASPITCEKKETTLLASHPSNEGNFISMLFTAITTPVLSQILSSLGPRVATVDPRGRATASHTMESFEPCNLSGNPIRLRDEVMCADEWRSKASRSRRGGNDGSRRTERRLGL